MRVNTIWEIAITPNKSVTLAIVNDMVDYHIVFCQK